jgi:hypothetical protein
MKNKIITYGIIFLTVLILFSCEKSDNQIKWGNSMIYMPQANILDGGFTHNYSVPLNNDSDNYLLDTVKNTINIYLGVYRSGLAALNSYSVKVAADIDTTNQIIADGTIANAVLLPADVYTLPTDVSVPDGQRETTFYLTIDRAKLIANYSSYFDKKLLLTVGISNPSRYTLNQSLSKTTIIIDAANFMPTPPATNLIQGGDMGNSSENLWTVLWANNPGLLTLEFGYTADEPTGTSGGCLRIFANDATDVNTAIYQAVHVEVGQKYQLSAKVKIPGGGSNFSMLCMVADVMPGTSTWSEANNCFMGINAWDGCGTTAFDGEISQVGCEGQGLFGNGIASNGIFTATKSTMYIGFQFGKWSGSFGGNILLNDVELIKVN